MVKKNYFTLFGLPMDFVLSLSKLEEAYLRLQKEFHPDRFATAVAVERELANHQTAEINLAYDTLKNPLTRARYLLELNGNYEADGENIIADNAFLMEQLRWREEVEEAEGSVDALIQLRQEVDEHLQQLYDSYAHAYKNLSNPSNPSSPASPSISANPSSPSSPSNPSSSANPASRSQEHQELVNLFHKMQYFTRLQQEIVTKLP